MAGDIIWYEPAEDEKYKHSYGMAIPDTTTVEIIINWEMTKGIVYSMSEYLELDDNNNIIWKTYNHYPDNVMKYFNKVVKMKAFL